MKQDIDNLHHSICSISEEIDHMQKIIIEISLLKSNKSISKQDISELLNLKTYYENRVGYHIKQLNEKKVEYKNISREEY